MRTNGLIAILLDVRVLIMLFSTSLLLSSCAPTNERPDKGQELTNRLSSVSAAYTDSLLERTREQESSFDALNTLQINTDEMNQLYSTFAGIVQPCYPPDSSFTITRAELLTAMEQFVTKRCTSLSIKERLALAATAVLAQEEYTVLHCLDSSSNANYENGIPMTGTWVMPNVLGRRDVILEW